ncbi:MAG TPA: response regulator transcription factor [Acidothermaceae bacterium]|nr:response regulator transcription factor [Acidothermaceae bacterium]
MTTVLICDDHRHFRDQLRRHVAAVPGVDRVATADTSAEAFSRYAAERPALVLLDVAMPDLGGPETARRLVAAHPGANVVMLAGNNDHEQLAEALAGGARGYLTKDASVEELCAALAHVFDAAAQPRHAAASAQTHVIDPPLTERERQVLDGMSRGKTNNEIGRELFLSEDTVKTHARRLFRKLGVNDRAQAVALGFRSGLVR